MTNLSVGGDEEKHTSQGKRFPECAQGVGNIEGSLGLIIV